MFPLFALILLSLYFSIRKKGSYKPSFTQTPIFKIFSEFGGIDKSLRIVQYLSLWMIGYLEGQSQEISNNSGVMLAEQINSVTLVFLMANRLRKMLRFLRAPTLFRSLKNRKILFNFSNKLEILSTLEIILVFLADVADLIFFFTDHYSVFYLLGIMNSKSLLQTMEALGNYLWVINALFYALSVIIKSILLKQACNSLDFRKTRTPYFLLGDFISFCIQIFVGLTFINPSLASKQLFSSLILMGCCYKLTKSVLI